MSGRDQQQTTEADSVEDFFDTTGGEFSTGDFDDDLPGLEALNDRTLLASKRRRVEQRLEALRLRDELGDDNFTFDDDF